MEVGTRVTCGVSGQIRQLGWVVGRMEQAALGSWHPSRLAHPPEQQAHKVRQDGVCAGLQGAAAQQFGSSRADQETVKSGRQNSSSCSYNQTRYPGHSAVHSTPFHAPAR
jgi:hypothetical protein